jgi:hypothetical protein
MCPHCGEGGLHGARHIASFATSAAAIHLNLYAT